MTDLLTNPIVILGLIIFLLIGLGFFIFISVYRQVLSTSHALSALYDLNNKTAKRLSGTGGQKFNIEIKCKNKQQFDSKSMEFAFASYIADHYSVYESVYNDIISDKKAITEYSALYRSIKTTLGRSWTSAALLPRKQYDKLEKRIFLGKKLRFQPCRFFVHKTYTSPKKRNHYSQKAVFLADYFVIVSDKIYEVMKRREEAAKERRMVDKRLRYEVMKRDGFQCQLCGRTRADGVILHVDHIIPVSKGGKSTMDNLRTLCADCNLGKGALFDENGLN